jgi:hypothetical protein
MKIFVSVFILGLLFPFTLGGCSQSSTFDKIIEYPGAIADQEHEVKMLGMSFATVKRVITDDSFDEVLAYYKNVLESYNPEVASHALEDGRQTAITISGHNSITIAIQEFLKEGKTAITYMN